MQIDPKYSFWFGVFTSILLGLATGAVNLPSSIPHDIATQITGWCAFFGWINSVILTALNGYSSSKSGPLTAIPAPAPTTIAKVLIAAFVLSFLLAGAPAAQAKERKPKRAALVMEIGKPRLTGDLGRDLGLKPSGMTSSGPLEDIIGALDAKLLPDLQYALKLATASGSKVTAPCYQAWIDIINVRQKAVKGDDGQDMPMPDPAIITKFEKIVELRNSLQPDSDFMIKCSPVASMVKKDIVGFIGIVLSGGAGLATLVPGL